MSDINDEIIRKLRDHYRCPHFRILIIGRANAGKTTILEKVCGVAKGTKPIIYDQNGKQVKFHVSSFSSPILGERLQQSETHLMPSNEVT